MADTATTFDIGGGVSAGVSAQSRKALIQVENYTSMMLYYRGARHDHGGFGVFPADKIEPGKANVFGAQNKGGSIMTGAEGWVTYCGNWVPLALGDPNYTSVVFFKIYWDNPYISDPFSSGPGNSATAVLSGQQNSTFKARYGRGAGNDAQFIYRLYEFPQIPGPQIAEI